MRRSFASSISRAARGLGLAALVAASLALTGCGGFLLVASGVSVGATSAANRGGDATRPGKRCDDPLATNAVEGGPEGGTVVSLAVAAVTGAQDTVRIAAGMDGAGLWITDLQIDVPGRSPAWYPSGEEIAHLTVRAVSIQPGNPNVILVGTDRGLYRSMDAGLTWKHAAESVAQLPIHHIVHAPWLSDVVFASTSTEILRSRDGGVSWTDEASPSGQVVTDFAAVVGSPSVVYAGTESGGVLWTSAGSTGWNALPALPTGNALALAASLPEAPACTESGRVLYVVTETTIYSWDEDQATPAWRDHGTTPGETKEIVDLIVTCGSIIANIQPTEEQARLKLARTSDDGITFNGELLTDVRVRSMAVTPAYPRLLVIGTQAGGVMWNLAEGVPWEWETDTTGLLGHALVGVHVDPGNPERAVVGTRSGDVFETDDQGLTWQRMPWGDRTYQSGFREIFVVPNPVPDSPFELYIATEVEGLLYVKDALVGVEASNPRRMERSDGISGEAATGIAFDDVNDIVYVSFEDNKVFRLDHPPALDPPNLDEITTNVSPRTNSTFSAAAADNGEGVVYFGNTHGQIFFTDPGGVLSGEMAISPGAAILDLEVSPSSSPDSLLFAAVAGGNVYRRDLDEPNGDWKELSRCLDSVGDVGRVADLAFEPFFPYRVYAATDQGLFRLDSKKDRWDAIGEGLGERSPVLSVGIPADSTSVVWAGMARRARKVTILE